MRCEHVCRCVYLLVCVYLMGGGASFPTEPCPSRILPCVASSSGVKAVGSASLRNHPAVLYRAQVHTSACTHKHSYEHRYENRHTRMRCPLHLDMACLAIRGQRYLKYFCSAARCFLLCFFSC